jgi:GNAT superfamily N-acetyltransferase
MTVQIRRLEDLEAYGPSIGASLSRAFHAEPNTAFLVPDERRRPGSLAWFFGVFVPRIGMRYGRVYAAGDPGRSVGAAVWMAPGARPTLSGALGAGLLSMPRRFGWSGFKRSMNLNAWIEQARHRTVPSPHWYLMALGVDPAAQGQGLGAALVRPVLAEADTLGLGCYLETFSERNLAFYGKLGFQVIMQDASPDRGPVFWGMYRAAAP